MKPALRARAAFIGAAVLTAAAIASSCGHGGSAVSPDGHGRNIEQVKFNIVVPTPTPTPANQPRVVSVMKVKHFFVSGNTTQATVVVTPQGGAPYPTVTFPCTYQSCTASVPAPVGVDTFLVSLYGGNRISPDTLLSTGATTATIQPGIQNDVNVTFDPVVSSIILTVTPSSLPPGTPGTATVGVNAEDATGYTIVGPGTYVNSQGLALTIDLSTFDLLLNGHQGHSTTLSPSSLNGPPPSGPTQVTLSYDGNPNLAQTTINATTTEPINGSITPAVLTVAASPSPSPSPTGCNVNATPQPAQFFAMPTPTGNPFATIGDSIADGPDGDIYSSDGSRRIYQATTKGKIKSFDVPGAGAGSLIATVTAGPAGGNTVWFANVTTQSVGRVTTGNPPTITVFPVPQYSPPANAQPAAIAAGPDGNMWFTDRANSYLGNITPLIGSISQFPITPSSTRLAQGVVVLPNGELWFVESGLAKLAMVQISSLQLGSVNSLMEFQPPSAKQNDMRNIAASPDGNIWFTEPTSDKVGRVNVNAVPITIDEFTVQTARSQPTAIGVGPDGAMWFAEIHGKLLGRIPFNAAPGTTPQEFSLGFKLPAALVTGSDCNLWVTDQVSPVARIGVVRF